MDITPLSVGFGAQISGFDPDGAVSEEVRALLVAAYDRHDLLIFRDCGAIGGERHAEIASWFGPVGANRDSSGNPWTTLDNEDQVGSAVLPFHCDIAYMRHPFAGLSLHPVAIPAGGTSTTFVSNALGWDHLDPDLQDFLADRTACHVLRDTAMVDADWPPLVHWHPARMAHPASGRPLLFVNENHATLIEGLDEQASAPILARIFATLYAVERQYEHDWRDGDLLVWNNLAIQHARTRVAARSAGRRIMQRVALGWHGFHDQVAELMAAAQGTVGSGAVLGVDRP